MFLGGMLLLPGHHAHAQQQERKLEERLTRPDMTLSNPAQNKAFNGGKSFTSTANSHAAAKPFLFSRWFRSKQFSTKSFTSENYTPGELKIPLSEAQTKESRQGEKVYQTKAAEVSEAREGDKPFAAGGYAGTRQFHGQGKSQKALDQKYANQEPMTIDQVRELLNKNK